MADLQTYQLADLLRVMQRLRDPEGGCPWDLAQDFRSIAPSTLEEARELVEAIEHNDFAHIPEELGDVLFQVIFYAQLGAEQGRFEFSDIVHTLVEKLLRRHPHVFADGDIEGVVDGEISVAEVLDKVDEELEEFRAAQEESKARREEELGDLIFTCVNLARHEGIDAESALRRATQKFERRFSQMEQALAANGESLPEASLQRMNELWEQAKMST